MVEGYSLTFEWSGGEYIDISFTNKEGIWGCINTFHDNEKIEFTRENFNKRLASGSMIPKLLMPTI